ncbi:MAG: transglutaminase domain-containing protein, partial [Spirochaetaceae bacterium]
AVIPAFVVARLLDATGPLLPVLAWSATTAVLFALVPHVAKRGSRILAWSGSALAIVAALVVFADVVIIPFSAYLLWFDLVQTGSARGAVSFVFVMLVAAGSAAFGAAVTRRPIIASSAYIAWLAFLSIPILGRAESVVVLAVSVGVGLVAVAAEGNRVRSAIRAISHAIVLAGLAVAIGAGLGSVTTAAGSRIVDDVLSPGFRRMVVTLFPNFPIVYDIPGYGYRFASENIGRSPVLSNRPLFRVSPVDDRPLYLRTEVFHEFTGSSWRARRDAPGDRELALVVEDPESAAESVAEPVAGPAAPFRVRTRIDILTDFYPMVPHTLDTVSFAITGRSSVRFDRAGESIGYVLTDPLLYGEAVELLREPETRGASGTETVTPDPDRYLSVPDSISESVRALAADLTGTTPSESMLNTLRFLRANFEYTLEPPQPRGADRFLEAFLEEHNRGFCVHFATAFTIISRLQGIPTRYVTGFLVQPPDFEELMMGGMPLIESIAVSGYSAHAWPEIWLEQTGWRIVEATPPMQPPGYENTFFDRFAAIRNEGRTVSQLSEILRRDITDPDREAEPSTGMLILRSVALIVIGLAFAVLIAIGVRRSVRLSVHRRFEHHASVLGRRTHRRGLPAPTVAGWSGWGAAAGRHGKRAARLILDVAFGGRRVTERDLRFIRRFRWRLMADLRGSR